MINRHINNMKQKYHYDSPAIRRIVVLQMRGEILSGSVKDHSRVTTMGQQVDDYNFSPDNDGGFNHQWQ